MTRYMLDTNMVSHLVRGHPQVVRRLAETPVSDVCLSAITEGELRFGMARKPDATRTIASLLQFLHRVEVLPWDSAVAERYGELRAAVERNGRPLGQLDMLIAAHAAHADAVLVTNDGSFCSVAGLVIEDWTKPASD